MNGRRRRAVFALAAVAIGLVATTVSLFALDVYLHARAARSAGLNVWGYRGRVVGRKQPGELRVAVLGGSTVFGYGITSDQAFPARLERRLNDRAAGTARYTVVNLGYNNEGAYSWLATLEDYAYLQSDIVCLYEGYNDLMGDGNGGNQAVYRHQSPIFRVTGYFPILPLLMREKAMALRAGGKVADAYAPGTTVFQPPLAARATSGALVAAADITESLERQFGRLAGDPPPALPRASASGCAYPWAMYCRDVAAAVDYALTRQMRVVFVTQPHPTTGRIRERHLSQQRAVAAMLQQRYASRIAYADLGNAVDLGDATLAFDGMHLTASGNARIADGLVQPILQLSQAARSSAP